MKDNASQNGALLSNTSHMYFIDNLKWITILSVILFHTMFYYNNIGHEPTFASNIPGPAADGSYPVTWAGIYQYSLYHWFMLFLFVLSGISAWHSLRKRPLKIFVSNRVKKLLVPSTLGVLALDWIGGKIIVSQHEGFIESIPVAFRYPVYCFAGINQMWFCQSLFFACMVLALCKLIDPKDRLHSLMEKAPDWVCGLVLALLCVPAWLCGQVLNTPEITLYRFGLYTFAVLAGYYVLSCDNVLRVLKKLSPLYLAVGIGLTVWYIIKFYGVYYYDYPVLKHPLTIISGWFMGLGVTGIAQYILNFNNKFTGYMSKSSFGVYTMNIIVMLTLDWLLIPVIHKLDINFVYIFVTVVSYFVCLGLYEILHRIPFIRFILFGNTYSENSKNKESASIKLYFQKYSKKKEVSTVVS